MANRTGARYLAPYASEWWAQIDGVDLWKPDRVLVTCGHRKTIGFRNRRSAIRYANKILKRRLAKERHDRKQLTVGRPSRKTEPTTPPFDVVR